MAPLPGWLKRRQGTDQVFRGPQPTAGSRWHRWDGGVRPLGRLVHRGWGPAGQHRSRLRHPEYSRKGLLGAAAARAPLRDHPGLAARGHPGRRPSGRRCRGPRCWFPSSQTRSQSEPASWPPPPAAPDLGGGKAAGHPTIIRSLRNRSSWKRPGTKPGTLGSGGGGGYGATVKIMGSRVTWTWPCHGSAMGPQTSDLPSLSLSPHLGMGLITPTPRGSL